MLNTTQIYYIKIFIGYFFALIVMILASSMSINLYIGLFTLFGVIFIGNIVIDRIVLTTETRFIKNLEHENLYWISVNILDSHGYGTYLDLPIKNYQLIEHNDFMQLVKDNSISVSPKNYIYKLFPFQKHVRIFSSDCCYLILSQPFDRCYPNKSQITIAHKSIIIKDVYGSIGVLCRVGNTISKDAILISAFDYVSLKNTISSVKK